MKIKTILLICLIAILFFTPVHAKERLTVMEIGVIDDIAPATSKRDNEGVRVKGSVPRQGALSWKSGSKYKGDVVDGKMHGKGIMLYADGGKYEGDFIEGQVSQIPND